MSVIFKALCKPPVSPQWVKVAAAPLIRWKSVGAREAPIIDVSVAIAKPEELEQKKKLCGTITVPTQVNISPITGVPEEHIKTRRVRIFIPPKNAMQSGTNNLHEWQIEYDNRERWENPLMGWTSTGDPMSNMQIEFNSKEEAIEHCEKQGLKWFIDGDHKPRKERVKNYGVNFSWNKRSRVSTK